MASMIKPGADCLEFELMAKDKKGQNVYRIKRLTNVKASANEQDVKEVALALAGLQQYPVAQITLIKGDAQ